MAQQTGKPLPKNTGKPTLTKTTNNVPSHSRPAWLNRLTTLEGPLFSSILLIAFVLFVLYQTLITNSPLLWKLHDQALFLTDLTYLRECLSLVGGLTIYAGSFLNAFFVYPWLGALIYTALLVLAVFVSSKAFHLKGWLFPMSIIPSLLLLLALTQNGYMIYRIKLDAFVYVAVLGLLVSLSGALTASISRKPLIQSILAVSYLLVAYPIAGVYGLMGALLMVAVFLRNTLIEKNPAHIIPAGTALIMLLLVPIGFDRWVYQATFQHRLYLTNLPDYWHATEASTLWLPYLLGAGFLLLMALLPNVLRVPGNHLKKVPLLLLLVTALFVKLTSYEDANFKTELHMMEATEKGDWNSVLRLAKAQKDEPTRLIVMLTQLALFEQNKLGGEKYRYKDGQKPYNVNENMLEVNMAGPTFYFHYGRMNYCYRWCMENTVEYGQSVTNLKYFVLSSAFNGEKELAQKYNNLLSRSLLHRKLAKKLQAIIEDTSLLKKDPTYNKSLLMTEYYDYLDSDYSQLEQYLRFSFANTVGGPPEMVELCLLANMELKNPNQFWPAYFLYTNEYKKSLPVHIQEAALLFNHLQQTNHINPDLFSPAVLKRFEQFLNMVQQYAGLPDYMASSYFAASFGDTYWYQFSFGNSFSNQKEVKFSPYLS